MNNVRIETATDCLSHRGYHLNESWLRDNEDRISIPWNEKVPIVCNECGYTKEITIATASSEKIKGRCPQCYQQRRLDEKFGADHVKILEYRGAQGTSKLYCTHLEVGFKRIISPMTKGRTFCICSGSHHIWKEIKGLAIERGYETLDNYSDEDIVNVETRITLRCKKHGIYTQELSEFLRGRGCSKCASESHRITREEAQARIDSIHGKNRYVIGNDYAGTSTHCSIQCTKCNRVNLMKPEWVISGNRCSCETESRGESFLNDFFDYMDLRYEKQIKFPNCKNENLLPFDFRVWTPGGNQFFLLEFDGIQHFREIPWWGGKEALAGVQRRDKIKNKFCEKNKIFLIRIQNKKRSFRPSDKDRVIAALDKAGAIMAFLSHQKRPHSWIIRIEI